LLFLSGVKMKKVLLLFIVFCTSYAFSISVVNCYGIGTYSNFEKSQLKSVILDDVRMKIAFESKHTLYLLRDYVKKAVAAIYVKRLIHNSIAYYVNNESCKEHIENKT
jgi:hypothetical protein